MRVLVSVDMEGIAGVVHGDDVRPGHSEYERNRKPLTAEANAAVRGVYAYDAGAQVLITHTFSGSVIADVRCDGRSLGELGLNTALASHCGVPPVLVSGDDTVADPVQLEVQVLRPRMTELALLVPGVGRKDGCTLRYMAPDFPTAYQVAELITTLGGM